MVVYYLTTDASSYPFINLDIDLLQT